MTFAELMYNERNGPICNLWTIQARISLSINAGWSGRFCLLTESMGTVVYVDGQRILWSDRTHMLLQILTYVARKLFKGHFRALSIKNDITEGDSIYSVEYIPFLTTMASLLISCLLFCAPIPCFSERRQRILIKSTAIESIMKTYLYNFDPLKPHFYIVKLGFAGVYIIFSYFCSKHRLLVLVRTASARRF